MGTPGALDTHRGAPTTVILQICTKRCSRLHDPFRAWETHASQQVPLEAGESVVDLAAGPTHSFAVTSAGRLFAWGDNAHGKLGVGGLSGKSKCITPR